MKQFVFLLSFSFLLTISVQAQQPYNLSNSNTTLYKNRSGIALDNQNPATPGNGQGQLVQLGYFSAATDSNLFSGTFMPLAQFNSGDSATGLVAVPNGRISLNTEFNLLLQVTNFRGGMTESTYATLSPYPVAGTPLAIRFYDTITTAGFYNSVSATNWDFVTPTNVPATAFVLNPDPASGAVGVAFQDSANLFIASIPEPSSMYFVLGGGLLAGFAFIKRRQGAKNS